MLPGWAMPSAWHGSGLALLPGAQHPHVLVPQPEPSAAGPAQGGNAAWNFPPPVPSVGLFMDPALAAQTPISDAIRVPFCREGVLAPVGLFG